MKPAIMPTHQKVGQHATEQNKTRTTEKTQKNARKTGRSKRHDLSCLSFLRLEKPRMFINEILGPLVLSSQMVLGVDNVHNIVQLLENLQNLV